jgi:hypothetical protein
MRSEEAGSVRRGIGSLGDDGETSTIIDTLYMDHDYYMYTIHIDRSAHVGVEGCDQLYGCCTRGDGTLW